MSERPYRYPKSVPAGKKMPPASAPPPVSERVSYIPVETRHSVTPNEWVVICEQGMGIYSHYISGRSERCVVDSGGDCEHCPDRNLRWTGYVVAVHRVRRAKRLLSITEIAQESIPELFDGKTDCAGWVLSLRRKSEYHRSPLLACWSDAEDVKIDRNRLVSPQELSKQALALYGRASKQKRRRIAVVNGEQVVNNPESEVPF